MLLATIYLFSALTNATLSEDTAAKPLEFPFHSYDEVNKDLQKFINEEHTLSCFGCNGPRTVKYNSCEEFYDLRKNGYAGGTTYEMDTEHAYKIACQSMQEISSTATANNNHFNIGVENWWHTLPAEIIPLAGGIFCSSDIEFLEHQLFELTNGKRLGEIEFNDIRVSEYGIDFILGKSEHDCGIIEDTMRIRTMGMVDVDGDGVDELYIRGYRADESETCQLGSGNYLGAGFSRFVTKPTADSLSQVVNR